MRSAVTSANAPDVRTTFSRETVYGIVLLVVMALSFLFFRERPSKVIMGCSVLALGEIYITVGAAVNLNEVIEIGLAFLMTLCVGDDYSDRTIKP